MLEPNSPALIELELTPESGVLVDDITVTVDASPGTASGIEFHTVSVCIILLRIPRLHAATMDYTPPGSIELVFSAGSVRMGFNIPITDDTVDEVPETILLSANLSVSENVARFTDGGDSAIVSILDDDGK